MVNVSKKYLEENLRRDAWHRFELEIDKGGSLAETFRKYFTEKEMVMIEKRLAIKALLEKGESYLNIRRRLDVSPATVSYVKQGFKRNKRRKK